MYKIGPWVNIECGAYRAVEGTDGDIIANRVAFIEKTPRVRIRQEYLGKLTDYERQWPEFLDWCEGYKGDGPEDKESRNWCDKMLIALGYTL